VLDTWFRKTRIDEIPTTVEVGLYFVYLMWQIQAISICPGALQRELTTLNHSGGIQLILIQEHRGHVQFLPRADAYTSQQVIARHADGSMSAANACARTWRGKNKYV
jgi:hypothetical protein